MSCLVPGAGHPKQGGACSRAPRRPFPDYTGIKNQILILSTHPEDGLLGPATICSASWHTLERYLQISAPIRTGEARSYSKRPNPMHQFVNLEKKQEKASEKVILRAITSDNTKLFWDLGFMPG